MEKEALSARMSLNDRYCALYKECVYAAYLHTVLVKQFELGFVIDNDLSKCYALLLLLQGIITNNTETQREFRRVHHDQRSTRVARSPFVLAVLTVAA